MKKTGVVVLMFGLAVLAMGHESRADMDSPSLANAVSIEGLGRGLVWSINYDRLVTDSVAVGFGFGTLTGATVIPFYMNFYPSPEDLRWYVTAGADVVLLNGAVTTTSLTFASTSGTTAIATAGLGYEYRGYSGFVFRIGPYVLVGANSVAAWVGASFGLTF